MKVISSYDNEKGIDILMQCADDIQAILTNPEVSKSLDAKGNFMKIGALAYKNCKKNVENVFKALGEKPASAIETTIGITQIILDIVSNQAFKDFFIFLKSKDMTQSASATENTEEEV